MVLIWSSFYTKCIIIPLALDTWIKKIGNLLNCTAVAISVFLYLEILGGEGAVWKQLIMKFFDLKSSNQNSISAAAVKIPSDFWQLEFLMGFWEEPIQKFQVISDC